MNKKRTRTCRIVLLLLALHAASSHGAEPRLTPQKSIEPVLKSVRQRYKLPAMAAAVIYEGRICDVAATGVRRLGSDIRVTRTDQFHLGSCTKAMTATLIGILIEQNKLGWDSKLADLLPALAGDMHAGYREVTIRQILAHQAGLPPRDASWPEGKSFMDMHRLPGPPMQQRLAYAKMILSQKPAARPGAEYIYSNAGYAIAGTVAEQITGTPWETLMRELIFAPLDMQTAGFGAMGTPGRIDQPWQHSAAGEKVRAIAPGPFSDNPAVIAPGGTVHCSMEDWAKFVLAHLNGARGAPGILRASTFKALHTPDFDGTYAKGWAVVERAWGGGTVLTHDGSNTNNYAVVWMGPMRNFAVMVACNQGKGKVAKACDEVCSKLIKRYLASDEPQPKNRRRRAR
jgi:CubicO group peptidase (beta-lactamase class C family)